jgi:hypothetical protein
MPPTRRIQRHFSPLFSRTRFSPERMFTPLPLTSQFAFPITEGSALPHLGGDFSPAADSSSESDSEDSSIICIPKPPGEAARPSRGYTLREVVEWDDATYERVQVRDASNTLALTHRFVLTEIFERIVSEPSSCRTSIFKATTAKSRRCLRCGECHVLKFVSHLTFT